MDAARDAQIKERVVSADSPVKGAVSPPAARADLS
jgi:hypothetical protein